MPSVNFLTGAGFRPSASVGERAVGPLCTAAITLRCSTFLPVPPATFRHVYDLSRKEEGRLGGRLSYTGGAVGSLVAAEKTRSENA